MNEWEENSIEQGELFKSLIILNQCKNIVEIGVALASTTSYLCDAANKVGGKVYGYDLWDMHGLNNQFGAFSNKEQCENYLKGKGYSNFELTKISTKTDSFRTLIKERHSSIDFAFIDGCHSYEGVKNDFDIIYPLLSLTGIVAFHDTLRIDGCREFIIDLRTKYFDGTFDIIDFPYGNNSRRVGISLLVKRSYPNIDLKIDEICGSISDPGAIYSKEKEWYKEQIKHYK